VEAAAAPSRHPVIGKRRTAQWETKRKIKLTYNIVKQ